MAATKPTTKRAPVEQYSGLMAAPLNELSQQEQRVRDVTARRQQDAVAYNAFVLGQHGKLAAASGAADQAAVRSTGAAQLMAAGANDGAMQRMIDTRKAQGFGGGVPAQQLAGLRDDSVRTNMLMAAGTRDAAEIAQQNQSKAGFLASAAMAGHQAAVARIAGEGSEQESQIRREKVGLLSQREELVAQIQAAEEQAKAEIAKAQLEAEQREADRQSRYDIAGMQIEARQMEGESDRAFEARQKSLDRKLKKRGAAGGRSDSEVRQSASNARALDAQRTQALALADQILAGAKKKGKPMPSAASLRATIASQLDSPDDAVLDYVLAAKYGSKAGVTSGAQARAGETAARRYYAKRKQISRGR